VRYPDGMQNMNNPEWVLVSIEAWSQVDPDHRAGIRMAGCAAEGKR